MNSRRVVQQLKRVRNPYNAEEMNYAIECVEKCRHVEALEKANEVLMKQIEEWRRERNDYSG